MVVNLYNLPNSVFITEYTFNRTLFWTACQRGVIDG